MQEWHEIIIPSTPRARQQTEAQIMKIVGDRGFSEEARFSIKLAMEEAVTNAFKHGNRFDKNKKVIIRYSCNDKNFTLSVRDEGEGFDPSRIPDPTAPENLTLPYGRGIMLMNAYMDRVAFSPTGNEVTMVKENR
ncbi:MAG TPA: ATP-binding protein [Planctomycetota bacterium]|nr:ATP-binding protein [Planctomycetota bacterium]